MKRIFTILIATVAGFALADAAVAQGRHDETPHGYNAKVAGEQAANAHATTYIVLPTGPRPQDNPLRGKKIAVANSKQEPAPVAAAASERQ